MHSSALDVTASFEQFITEQKVCYNRQATVSISQSNIAYPDTGSTVVNLSILCTLIWGCQRFSMEVGGRNPQFSGALSKCFVYFSHSFANVSEKSFMRLKGCRFVSTDTPKWSHDIDRTTVYSPARHNVLRAAEKQRRRLNKNKNNDHGGDTLLKKDNETKI
ncbi:hypothetical protein BDP27DRAFT_588458 [Rhodocollybia butyracea]|uniref:Uncharacterized protein n=1 Tax=Rhodocollybia butyracea TaxID=206335 RepID=A0A9P5U929_9AGAR|nr:hypothetical protein BDP27DRAFT_588458 [Rhodocollybia butyracea]